MAAVAQAGRAGEGSVIPREQHVWGHFEVGAWKAVRVSTETFDNAGLVTNISVTDTTSTLSAVDDQQYTLKIESMAEVASKRITAAPQTIVQRYDGAPSARERPLGAITSERVVIDGLSCHCDIFQIETAGPMSRTTSKIFYCKSTMPYLLRREAVTTNLQTNVITSRSTTEVIALDMPTKVRNEMMPATHFKATHQHERGTNITLLVSAFHVPGGVVSHTSKELDSEGRLVRRSTLELLDYGSVPQKAAELEVPNGRRPRLFRRHRIREGASPGGRSE